MRRSGLCVEALARRAPISSNSNCRRWRALTDPTTANKTSSNSTAWGAHARLGASKLTPREAEVVHLIAFGYSNKEIAGQLGIGIKSIETYKARACEKLDVRSRSDLVRYAIMQGWLGTYPSAD